MKKKENTPSSKEAWRKESVESAWRNALVKASRITLKRHARSA